MDPLCIQLEDQLPHLSVICYLKSCVYQVYTHYHTQTLSNPGSNHLSPFSPHQRNNIFKPPVYFSCLFILSTQEHSKIYTVHKTQIQKRKHVHWTTRWQCNAGWQRPIKWVCFLVEVQQQFVKSKEKSEYKLCQARNKTTRFGVG